MQLKKTIVLPFIFFAIVGFCQDKVVYLQNEFIKAGLLPDVGGRMVFLAPVGQENFLLSDSSLWNEPQSKRIIPSPTSPFKGYFGFITWVGPQSEWWTHQDLNPNKKTRADVWPPDPYLIYSDFKVLKKTETLLILEGPASPISGVQFTKKYELKGKSIEIEVTAKNIRDVEISWDLWSNARFPARTEFSVPVESEDQIRIQADSNNFVDKMEYQYANGSFKFIPKSPSGTKRQRVSKAFINPAAGTINVKKGGWKLNINFEKVPKENIHSEQALIEVYNNITTSGRDDVLELEHHSAYQTLAPNKTMSLKEVWSFEHIGPK